MKKYMIVSAIATLLVAGCASKDIENESKGSIVEDNKQEVPENTTAEKSGTIITLGDRAVEIFYGNEETEKRYSNTISSMKQALGEQVEVYNMVVPTSVEFALPKKYQHMSKPQKPVIDKIYDNLNSEIKTVDAYKALEKHKNEYLYFNTDHHWTSLGAYYAYEQFAKEAGFKAKSLDEYEKYSKKDFLGTLFTQTQDTKLKENKDVIDYYKIPVDYKVFRYEKGKEDTAVPSTLYADYANGVNAYSIFLHGDFPMIKIQNNDSNKGRKLVVVKESYGNAFVPFLIPHYDEIYVVDTIVV
ncbi:DHHW family protein [Peribacillus sp. R9-11]|uniref:DHHW family protein n=1 Tax=Peribacillus sp. R9-11 TaxID=3073271 RepID=UPI002868FAF6|nr:DHHW family protein [Peribacillus sp. R9-11]WMX57566.1 DHHW family protein [Peribacillus sp. R9-11]